MLTQLYLVLPETTTTNFRDQGRNTCNCPEFLKIYTCIHSLSMAIKLDLAVVPLEAKDIAIGKKPKVGRSSRAKKALLIR